MTEDRGRAEGARVLLETCGLATERMAHAEAVRRADEIAAAAAAQPPHPGVGAGRGGLTADGAGFRPRAAHARALSRMPGMPLLVSSCSRRSRSRRRAPSSSDAT